MKPDTWDDIRVGGKKIKDKSGIPVGVGLSAELDTAMAMRAIMYSFGSHEQDAEGNLTINSPQTLEAIKYVTALFKETMTPEVFAWDPSSNNRQMLAGRSSLVLNAISVTRTGENDKLPIHEKIGLAKAAKGPVRRMGLEHVMDCLRDLEVLGEHRRREEVPGRLHRQLQARLHGQRVLQFPVLRRDGARHHQIIIQGPEGRAPPDKYAVLADVLDWATNVGYPGYSNAAIDETFNTWVINTMFAAAATGAETPENALETAPTPP